MFSRLRYFSLFFQLLILCLGAGCGGGSLGTGTEPRTSFSGSVSSEKGVPLAGAVLKLRETGESVTAAADGTFLLESTLSGGTATFDVTAAGVQGEVNVSDLPMEGASVQLDVTVDIQRRQVTLENVSITAKIEGNCDPFFENNRTIRQSGRVPDGTLCPVRVRVRRNGIGLPDVPFVLQRRRCFEGAPWHEVESGFTGTDPAGFGELRFAFSNAEEFCVYRILVQTEVNPQLFLIETFRKQAFDGGFPFDPNSGDGR